MKSPCVRGLKRFDKKGCPEIPWNETRQEGCTCWVSMPVVDEKDPTKARLHWCCVDLIAHHQRHQMLTLLQGVQSAVESFRNGMIEDVGGDTKPKNSAIMEAMLKNAVNNRLIGG